MLTPKENGMEQKHGKSTTEEQDQKNSATAVSEKADEVKEPQSLKTKDPQEDKTARSVSTLDFEFSTQDEEKKKLAKKLQKLAEEGVYKLEINGTNVDVSSFEKFILEAVGANTFVLKDPKTGNDVATLSTAKNEDIFITPVIEEIRQEQVGNQEFLVTYDKSTGQEVARELVLPENPVPHDTASQLPDGSITELRKILASEYGKFDPRFFEEVEKDGKKQIKVKSGVLLEAHLNGVITTSEMRSLLREANEFSQRLSDGYQSKENVAVKGSDDSRELKDTAAVLKPVESDGVTKDKQEITQHTFAKAITDGYIGRLKVTGHKSDSQGFLELEVEDPDKPGESIWISSNPKESPEAKNVMGGGAVDTDEEEDINRFVRAGLTEEEARKKVAEMIVQANIAQRRLIAAQQGERTESEELLRKRIDSLTPAELQRLVMVQESAERSAISMMHKISIWLREDESVVRAKLVDDLRTRRPELSYKEAKSLIDNVRLDHRQFDKIRKNAEEVIRLIEQNPELEFRSGAIQELFSAIENGASGYDGLVYEIQNMIYSRSMDRGAFLAAKYKGGKDFGAALNGYLPEHHNAYYLPGVEAMSAMLEEATDESNKAQTIGQYYRRRVWRHEYDNNGNLVKKLLKYEGGDYLKRADGEINKDYKLDDNDLQAELKIRLVRMKSDVVDKNDPRPDIVKRNKGGLGIPDDTFSDAILAYAFTEIQKSTEGGEGKFIIRAEDIADRLMGKNKDENGNEYIGIREKGGRFQGMTLQITASNDEELRKKRELFIKAVDFAQRAYDIAHQKAVITGLTIDAQGPILSKSGLKRRGINNKSEDGVDYDVLALPEHVWLTVPDRIDTLKIWKQTSTQIENLKKRIGEEKDEQKKSDLEKRVHEICELQVKWGLSRKVGETYETIELTDEEREKKERELSKELFQGLEGTRVDLRDVSKLTESQKLILKQVRNSAGFLISSSWNLALRDYFHNHMDDIDADGSRIRSAVREVGGLIWLNVYLSTNTNRNAGKAAELRKDTFLGAVSPMRAIGRDSIGDLIENWGDNYAVVARHESDRLTGAAAIKSGFYEGDASLLHNVEAITDVANFVKPLIKPMREYMDMDELGTVINSWVESLVLFNAKDLKKYGYSDNMNMEEVYALMSKLITHRVSDKETSEKIKEKLYGPWLWRNFKYHGKKGDTWAALWEFISGYFQQTAGQSLKS